MAHALRGLQEPFMGSGSLRGFLVLLLLLCSVAHGSAVRPADGHQLVLRDLVQGLDKLSVSTEAELASV